jgi:hypothetical protein
MAECVRLQADAADEVWRIGSKSKLISRGTLKANTETIILVHGNMSGLSLIEPINVLNPTGYVMHQQV